MKMQIKIDNSRPVELANLTSSLQGFGRAYKRFLTQGGYETEYDIRLLVQSVKGGSIEVELVNGLVNLAQSPEIILATAAPFLEHTKPLLEFAGFVKEVYEFFNGKGKRPDNLTGPTIKDFSQTLEPTARDSNGNIHINARDDAKVYVSVKYDSNSANAMQNRAAKELEAMREPEQLKFPKVLMYWHRAGVDERSHTTDRAIVESITPKPLRVFFPDEDVATKKTMIAGKENPFTTAFLVDIELHTIKGRPYAYKVTHLHETLDDQMPDGNVLRGR